MLPDILNYVPDPKNGRPLVDAKVYFLVEGYDAPAHDSEIDPSKIAPITYVNDGGNIITVPQPVYTSKGGTLLIGSQFNQPELTLSADVRKVAIYDKCGAIIYQIYYSSLSNGAYAIVQEGTPPTSGLRSGARWYKPSEATTYILYKDGDSSQWVQESVASAASAAAGEVITNARGTAIKRPDGTMICRHNFTTKAINVGVGGLFQSDNAVWTFPVPFVGAPSIIYGSSSVPNTWGVSGDQGVGADGVSVRAMSPVPTTATVLTIIAEGRWLA